MNQPIDDVGDGAGTRGYLNDMWERTEDGFKWIAGSPDAARTASQAAVHDGSAQHAGETKTGRRQLGGGDAAPSPRTKAAVWAINGSGLVVFGGEGVHSDLGGSVYLSDGSVFDTSTATWTKLRGPWGSENSNGSYGDVTGLVAWPGARVGAVAWALSIDGQNASFIFGGEGFAASSAGALKTVLDPAGVALFDRISLTLLGRCWILQCPARLMTSGASIPWHVGASSEATPPWTRPGDTAAGRSGPGGGLGTATGRTGWECSGSSAGGGSGQSWGLSGC